MTPENTQPLDLEAIEARWKAASHGPWYNNGYCGIFTDSPAESHGIASIFEDRIAGDTPTAQGEANREFITCAHADIPALIAEVRRLRALAAPGLSPSNREVTAPNLSIDPEGFVKNLKRELEGVGTPVEAPGEASPRTELVEALAAIELADAEVTRAHTAQWEGKQPAWRITIPADPKRDSDIIIGRALRLAKAALEGQKGETRG
jgi:hypothetical protein